MLAAFEYALDHHDENYDVDDHTREHVESVEPGDEEEEVRVGLLNRVFVVVHVRPKSEGARAGIPKLHGFISTDERFVFYVLVERQCVQFRFVGVLTNLYQFDAVITLHQRDVGFSFNPWLGQMTKVVVHEYRIAFGKVEYLAIICGHRHVFCQQEGPAAAVDEVRPFPSLGAEEEKASNDGQSEPADDTALVVAVAGLYSEYHGDRRHDENERHQGNIDERVFSIQSGECAEDLLANGPRIRAAGANESIRCEQSSERQSVRHEEIPHHHLPITHAEG